MYGGHYKGKGKDGSEQEIFLDTCENMEKLLEARSKYSYGTQRDYFDYANCVGWTREGTDENPGSGCAVLLSNSDEGRKNMEIGKKFAGKIFIDFLEKHAAKVTINDEGWGEFYAAPGSASVWICK
jgi:alpha-amylase